MRRLPKGLKRISKEDFVKEMANYQEEKGILFDLESRKYEEWSKKEKKNSYKKAFRW